MQPNWSKNKSNAYIAITHIWVHAHMRAPRLDDGRPAHALLGRIKPWMCAPRQNNVWYIVYSITGEGQWNKTKLAREKTLASERCSRSWVPYITKVIQLLSTNAALYLVHHRRALYMFLYAVIAREGRCTSARVLMWHEHLDRNRTHFKQRHAGARKFWRWHIIYSILLMNRSTYASVI